MFLEVLRFHSLLDAKGSRQVRCAGRGSGAVAQEAGLRPLCQREHSAGPLPRARPGPSCCPRHEALPGTGARGLRAPNTWVLPGGGLGLCRSVGTVGRFLRAVEGWEVQEKTANAFLRQIFISAGLSPLSEDYALSFGRKQRFCAPSLQGTGCTTVLLSQSGFLVHVIVEGHFIPVQTYHFSTICVLRQCVLDAGTQPRSEASDKSVFVHINHMVRER